MTGWHCVFSSVPRDAVMRRGWLRAAVLAAACAFAIEAVAQLYATPLNDATPPYELNGYSVEPPRGAGWFEMQRDRQHALFGKKLPAPTHAVVATATAAQLGEPFANQRELLDYVNRMRGAQGDAARYRMGEFTAEPDASFGAWCVRYYAKSEDRGAPNARGRALLLEHFGITCVHPVRQDLVIDVGYSERGRPGGIDATLRNEGENFMRSLKFRPFQR